MFSAFRFKHSFGYSLIHRNLPFFRTNLKDTFSRHTRLFESWFFTRRYLNVQYSIFTCYSFQFLFAVRQCFHIFRCSSYPHPPVLQCAKIDSWKNLLIVLICTMPASCKHSWNDLSTVIFVYMWLSYANLWHIYIS
jgi:hypothetical protein